MHYFRLFSLASYFVSATSLTAQIYMADWGTDRTLVSHVTDAEVTVPDSVEGANWTLSWDSAPSTDTSANFFAIEGGGTYLFGEDWGGEISWTTDDIDVSSFDSVTIEIAGTAQNSTASEEFTLSYSLDGAPTQIASYSETGSTVDYGVTLSSIDVSGVATLTVGFFADFNGGSDFVKLDDVTVTDATAIPEPTTYAAMAGMLVLGIAGWRRRR